MKNTPHTPTPWNVETFRQYGEDFNSTLIRAHGFLADAMNEDNVTVACMTHMENGPANAAFIVRACNSHAALVAALKFYADKRSYEGSNQLAKKGEESQGPYRLDVGRDGGAKARAVLAAVKKGKP